MNINRHIPQAPSIMNKSKSRHAKVQSLLGIVAFAFCTAICSGADLGSGYLFYKEQGFHPDSKAVVKEVVSFEVFPAISRGKTKSGQLLQITAGQAPVFLPDPNGAASPADVARQIKQLATKYPQHQVLFDKLLAVCSSKQKAPPAAPLATPSAATASGVSSAQNKAEFYVVLADGTKIQNIKTAALAEDSIKLISDDGIRTVTSDSIQLSLSNLSPEAKAVIEKGKAATEAKRKSEATRIAAEEKEPDHIQKEQQDKRLTQVEVGHKSVEGSSIEVTNPFASLDQMPITKKTVEQQIADNEILRQTIKKEEEQEAVNKKESRAAEVERRGAEVETILSNLPDFTIESRGPAIHGFRLGMPYSDFVEKLNAVASQQLEVTPGWKADLAGLVDQSKLRGQPNVEFKYINFCAINTNATSGTYARVVVSGKPPTIIYLSLFPALIHKLFISRDLSFKEFCQKFIDAYNIPSLNGTPDGYVQKMAYKSEEGWAVSIIGDDSFFHVDLAATPIETQRGFGR